MTSKVAAVLADLKRRRIYRVAAVYVVVGLGILSAAEVVLDPIGLGALRSYLVIFVLLCFPVAVVLAAVHERAAEQPEATDVLHADQVITTGSPDAVEVAVGRKHKSIVVLPFDNMSPDSGDAYFCDGLTEEIIMTLSHLKSLRVISRNSAMALKGTQQSTLAIAETLGVQYVLEGGVRKSGNELRITAQLIDAEHDAHMWAERYDGVLQDVFGIQEQVARAIVAALALELGSFEERRLVSGRTEDLRAYECYLRARHELLTMGDGFYDRCVRLIDRGLGIAGDSDVLHALKGHVLVQMVNVMSVPSTTFEEVLADARLSTDRALALNPDSAMAHAVRGAVAANTGDPHGAVRHYAEALRIEPSNPEALLFLGWSVAAGGWDPDGSRGLLERAGTVDPLTPFMSGATGWLEWMLGDFGTALESFEEWSIQLEAVKSQWRIVMAYLHAAAGDTDTAVQVVDRMTSDAPDHLLTALARFLRCCWLGDKEGALRIATPDLETAARWDDLWPLMMAAGYSLIDDRDRAFQWLEHAVKFGLTNASYISAHDPFLERLRSDERFGRLVGRAEDFSKSLSDLVDIGAILAL